MTGSRKRSIYFIAAVFLIWLACDAIVYFYLLKLQSHRNIFYGIRLPDRNTIQHLKKTYHQDWGWDIKASEKSNLGSRNNRFYDNKPLYKMKAFGDSYTFSITGDHETWCRFIEEKTGADCLNYGVGGYGPDQALLKYKDIPQKSEYVLFGILDENIGRIVTNWWGFYHKQGIAAKPRYAVRGDSCIFIPNPIGEPGELENLANMDFINAMKPDDYWNRYYEKIGAPDELRYPSTLTLLQHRSFFYHYFLIMLENYFRPTYESMAASKKFYHLYEPGSEGLKILECVIDEFALHASGRGEKPLVLLFPIKHTVDMLARFDKKPYQPVADYLSEKQQPFIDFGELFVNENYQQYYDGNGGHLSSKGNERVAEEIIAYLNEMESL